jgi:methylglutaconyl-CoA hydratase
MNQTTPTDQVLWRVDERGVAYVTLNRPEIYNAYDGELIAALLVAFDQLGREPVRLAVISAKDAIFKPAPTSIGWTPSGARLRKTI